MEEATYGREDALGNVTRQSSLRPGRSFKSTTPGRYAQRLSPSFRRLHSSRIPCREQKGGPARFQWIRGNRVLFWLMLITLWAYLGFHIQSQWAHGNHDKDGFIVSNSGMNGEAKAEDLIRISDVSAGNTANSSSMVGRMVMNGKGKPAPKKRFGLSLVGKGRRIFSPKKVAIRRKNKRAVTDRGLRSTVASARPTIVAEDGKRSADLGEGIPRKNTSYGLIVGPFEKMAEQVLSWSPEKRRGTCDRSSDFARLVWSRKFVLVFNELSMTSAPLSMMELATELLSCGGYVTVVPFTRKGGLMGELTRRNIKVLPDNAELGYKTALKADLVIAGSAASSPWIERYVKRFAAGSNQLLWWIMESQRESFDRSKNILDKVKMLVFLSEAQSKQWLTWCGEEKIQLKAQPEVVHLSISDELAFVAGIASSLNTPLFSIEKMKEKRNSLRVAVRKDMGLSEDDMLVASLGGINPDRGQSFLLAAALLVTEKNQLPPIDVKIKTLNMSEISTEDDADHKRSIKLEDNLLLTNATTGTGAKKKKKRRRSRKATRKSRSLLATSEDVNKHHALKVLIGSVGSKSNKVKYIQVMLRFLSQHPDLSKSLLWTPATLHISPIHAAADVYVLNAQGLGEAFDIATIEAMAFGLPVLATDAGGIKEIVVDEATGLLHPVGQEGTRTLASNLKFLLENPSAREQLGSNGRLKVEKMFLKRHMYKRLREVFVKCMKTK